MEPAELNRFLAAVRKTRIIDYLDPIGFGFEHFLADHALEYANAMRNVDNIVALAELSVVINWRARFEPTTAALYECRAEQFGVTDHNEIRVSDSEAAV